MLSDQTVTLLATVGSSFGAVASLGWWLSGRFRAIEISTQNAIAKHEEIDQHRHEENLGRFSKINMGLVRLGLHDHDA